MLSIHPWIVGSRRPCGIADIRDQIRRHIRADTSSNRGTVSSLANVEREITVLCFPVASWEVLQVKKNQIRNLHEPSKNYQNLLAREGIVYSR